MSGKLTDATLREIERLYGDSPELIKAARERPEVVPRYLEYMGNNAIHPDVVLNAMSLEPLKVLVQRLVDKSNLYERVRKELDV